MSRWIVGLVFFVGWAVACQGASDKKEKAKAPGPLLEGKKVAMIIAHRNFRDEELLTPQRLLEKQGVEVTVVCSRPGEAQGMLGAKVKPDEVLDSLKVEAYDAVVFVGGAGAKEYWDHPKAHAIARSALGSGKWVCAICIAPVTLANAGVLEGKRATVWASEAGRIQEKGATYTGAAVEVDGHVITANGSGAARRFAEAIIAALKAR